MRSFSYKGISCRDFGIVSRSVNRSMLPALRGRTTEVYGKHGLIDYGNNNYGIRQISVHIGFSGSDFLAFRKKSREISAWLRSSQWERLVFDDEPDKYYLARIYGAVPLDDLFRAGETDITFECQPFAYLFLNTGDDPTWEDADFPWMTVIPWLMANAYKFNF